MTLLNDIQVWTTACAYDHLIPGRGVGVLLELEFLAGRAQPGLTGTQALLRI